RVYTTPGHTLLAAGFLTELDMVRYDLGRHFFLEALSASDGAREVLKRLYGVLEQDMDFREEIETSFGYVDENFFNAFWGYYAWPPFENVRKNQRFVASVDKLMHRASLYGPDTALVKLARDQLQMLNPLLLWIQKAGVM